MAYERYRRLAGSVSNIAYHFVWCPKFRRPVLVDSIASRLTSLLEAKVADIGCDLLALEVMPDHVHLFLSAPPVHAPQYIANQVKGYTSRILRSEFQHLRSRLPSLWSRSYYVGSAGAVSAETIQRYIEQQPRS
jgi:putative transposase